MNIYHGLKAIFDSSCYLECETFHMLSSFTLEYVERSLHQSMYSYVCKLKILFGDNTRYE